MTNIKRRMLRMLWTVADIAPRCECGWRIWPWQERAYDPDLCKDIHASCGTVEALS